MKHSGLLLCSIASIFCLFINTAHTQQFPRSVRTYMATRQMRYHHYMWHQIRGNWNKFSASTQNDFRNIGWAPPSPARDALDQIISTNFAGEDFLYMHRHMIQLAKQTATQNRESTAALIGWTTIPAPGDKTYPVPPAFPYGNTSNYFAEYKTDDRYQAMKNQEAQFKDPRWLKGMTLNDLGLRIENNIHNALHYRWTSASSFGYRTGGVVTTQTPNISKTWDNVAYDWMGDSYASHVNPYFWKLHGWIDDRIEDWRKANNLTSVRFSGTWTGGPMANLGNVLKKQMGGMQDMSSNSEDVGDILEKAFEIFANSGVPEITLGGPVSTAPRKKRVLRSSCAKR